MAKITDLMRIGKTGSMWTVDNRDYKTDDHGNGLWVYGKDGRGSQSPQMIHDETQFRLPDNDGTPAAKNAIMRDLRSYFYP
jgi:hypothetical protein